MPRQDRPSGTRGLARRVSDQLTDSGLAGSGSLLLVGVSGGGDSVCLLHCLAGLRKRLSFDLHAAHLDHQLRGEASAADAAYVAALCDRMEVPLTVEQADVKGYRRRMRVSLEEAGRDVRYAFFAALAAAVGARAVAVGHTADDQVETVLMHIVRGSGLTGLRGMTPSSHWEARGGPRLKLIRPLLGTWRRETSAYCQAEALDPRDDPSNRSPRFLRNRIRHELLPLLRQLNPGIDRGMLRLAENAGHVAERLDDETERVWKRVARLSSGIVELQARLLAALPPSLQRLVMRRALLELRGNLRGIAEVHTKDMLRLTGGPVGKTLHLPGGLRFHAGYDAHTLEARAANADSPPLEETPLQVPGVTKLPGWQVEAGMTPVGASGLGATTYAALLDPALSACRLRVRSRRPGDRFQPLGMAGTKKLQDFLVDAKVSRRSRDAVPLVCAGDDIIWIVGHRISERARVPPGCHHALRITFQRL